MKKTTAAAPAAPNPPRLTVNDVLMAIATAQKQLHMLALQELTDDQADGIRWTSWLNRFSDLRHAMVDDAGQYSDVTGPQAEAITKQACG